MKNHLHKLIKYNLWRHQKIYQFICEMQQPQNFIFQNFECLFFNTPKATIDHLLISDQYWKMRLLKQTDTEDYSKLSQYWSPKNKHLFNEHWSNDFWLKHYRQDTGRMMNNYIEILNNYHSDQALLATIKYPNSSGVQREKSVQDIFSHVVNHHTHHLGQLSSAYKYYSKSDEFPSLDYTYYLD